MISYYVALIMLCASCTPATKEIAQYTDLPGCQAALTHLHSRNAEWYCEEKNVGGR